MALDVAAFKQAQRKIWSSGDYPDIAARIESAAEHLVTAADVQPGQDVVDVATGSGNVALVAARRGANVTGLDITPELFDAARRRAAEAGVDIEWVEGDAEELPYRGRLVRPRAVGLRHDVRAAARARPPPNWCASRSRAARSRSPRGRPRGPTARCSGPSRRTCLRPHPS